MEKPASKEKLQRVDAKHIRHNPQKAFKYSDLETTIHIKSNTPYISAVKRTLKLLKNLSKKQPKVKYITLLGMGAAIQKTLSVGLHFQEEEGAKVEVMTKSVEVLDEFEYEDEDNENSYSKRKVTAVEVHVYKTDDLL
jgi:ribonuclease P/MRP protein subunit POP7